MKQFLAFCVVAAGLAMVPLTQATAHEAPARVTVPVSGTNAVLPATVRINDTVVVRERRPRRHYHRRYRTVRRTVYRNGRRTVVVRRVYY